MGRRYLVTGGAGFIGSNFIRYVLANEPSATVTNLDSMSYAGIKATVDELDLLEGHTFVKGDIGDPALMNDLAAEHDVIVHFAGESHVDRSIKGPAIFLETNFVGTGVLIEAARRYRVDRFVYVSTDEVYGSVEEGFAREDSRFNPSSPYSVSKAAADLLVSSYMVTFDYPARIARCTNNYGPYQFPEKVIPLFVTNLLDGLRVPLYGSGRNERDWMYVEDTCAAIHLLVDEGGAGEAYNVGADAHITNRELTSLILEAMGKDESWIDYVPDRPGHDLRYAVDSSKIRGLGWAPARSLDQRLEETISWYREREDWWRPLKDGMP